MNMKKLLVEITRQASLNLQPPPQYTEQVHGGHHGYKIPGTDKYWYPSKDHEYQSARYAYEKVFHPGATKADRLLHQHTRHSYYHPDNKQPHHSGEILHSTHWLMGTTPTEAKPRLEQATKTIEKLYQDALNPIYDHNKHEVFKQLKDATQNYNTTVGLYRSYLDSIGHPERVSLFKNKQMDHISDWVIRNRHKPEYQETDPNDEGGSWADSKRQENLNRIHRTRNEDSY